MSDVLVIGGGMAGAIAALSAKRVGANVTVVRRALGATALSSGAVDVAVDPAAPPGDWGAQCGEPVEAAVQVARHKPSHPYAVVRESLGRLPEALSFATEMLDGVLVRPSPHNVLLPTPLGTVKPSALCLASIAGSSLTTMPSRVGVVQWSTHPAFDARWVASGVMQWAKGLGRSVEAVVVRSEYFRDIEDALRPVSELADRMDAPGAAQKLAEELKRVLPAGIELLLFPPMLGRKATRSFIGALEAALGIRCAETLSGVPSVPGLRLQEALDRALDRAGIRVRQEDYVAPEQNRALPQATVLATGKFVGGGIVRDHQFREAIFGLPVYAGGRPVRDEYIGDLLVDTLQGQQVAFRAGVRTDAKLRPLNAAGQVADARLFAAGAVLSGYDPAVDKTGLGVAILTGFLAGEWAAS